MEQYKEILDNLSALASAKTIQSAEVFLHHISRAANRLAMGSPGNRTVVLLAADLAAMISAEKQLAAVGKRNENLGEGFFKSLKVLRAEFEKALRS